MVSSDGIFCVLPSYVLWAYFITRTETIQEAFMPQPTAYSTRNGSLRSSYTIFSIRGLSKKKQLYILNDTVQGCYLFSLPFSPQQGFQAHYPGRNLRAPGAFTRRCRRRATGPRAHLGPPSGHSPSMMAGYAEWYRTYRQWNEEGWISGH